MRFGGKASGDRPNRFPAPPARGALKPPAGPLSSLSSPSAHPTYSLRFEGEGASTLPPMVGTDSAAGRAVAGAAMVPYRRDWKRNCDTSRRSAGDTNCATLAAGLTSFASASSGCFAAASRAVSGVQLMFTVGTALHAAGRHTCRAREKRAKARTSLDPRRCTRTGGARPANAPASPGSCGRPASTARTTTARSPPCAAASCGRT